MWLLKQEVAQAMREASRNTAPTAQQLAEFAARRSTAESRGRGSPDNMTIAGDVAEIRVEGVLTQKPDFIAWLFSGGNTTYEDIQAAFGLAESDETVKRVSLYIASPGGRGGGLFDTLAMIQGFTKPNA